MPKRPLWTERHGGTLALTKNGFATLLVHAFEGLTNEGCFAEVLKRGGREWTDEIFSDVQTAKAFFSMRLGDPWAAHAMDDVVDLTHADDAKIFDMLELLHHDAVSAPREDSPSFVFDKAGGQRRFRDAVNPILARREPPLEMDDGGIIVQLMPEPFRRLVEQPLPATAPKREVAERVADAVAHFRRRDAKAGDRRAAVRELADVLEFLRADVKVHMPSQDERDLFRIANEFALRHNKPTTRRDFDEPVWLAWLFYVYLATIRLVLELSRREGES